MDYEGRRTVSEKLLSDAGVRAVISTLASQTEIDYVSLNQMWIDKPESQR
jgi:hypothetical protein